MNPVLLCAIKMLDLRSELITAPIKLPEEDYAIVNINISRCREQHVIASITLP